MNGITTVGMLSIKNMITGAIKYLLNLIVQSKEIKMVKMGAKIKYIGISHINITPSFIVKLPIYLKKKHLF
jgi:hypothetical protein